MRFILFTPGGGASAVPTAEPPSNTSYARFAPARFPQCRQWIGGRPRNERPAYVKNSDEANGRASPFSVRARACAAMSPSGDGQRDRRNAHHEAACGPGFRIGRISAAHWSERQLVLGHAELLQDTAKRAGLQGGRRARKHRAPAVEPLGSARGRPRRRCFYPNVNLAKITSARLNALSTASAGVIPLFMTSACATPKSFSALT